MNMYKFGIYILILGTIILAYGAFMYLTNANEKMPAQSMNYLDAFGKALELEARNLQHANNRSKATTTMIVGGIVAFIGIALRASSKKKVDVRATPDGTQATTGIDRDEKTNQLKIRFSCNNCGSKYIVDSIYSGKKGKCKKCGSDIQVPHY